jgi:hypothetical protein
VGVSRVMAASEEPVAVVPPPVTVICTASVPVEA